MTYTTIQALKPNVTQEEALRVFRSGFFSSAYWRLRSGRMQRLAQAYVPFWMYRVRYQIAGVEKTHYFALDAVHGTLDLFEFPRVPDQDALLSLRTRNRIEARLSEEAARELLRGKVLRALFQQGFFKMRSLAPQIERVEVDLHLPYWLAFYGHNGIAKCRVLDAVRRRMEGAKASYFFEEWLAA